MKKSHQIWGIVNGVMWTFLGYLKGGSTLGDGWRFLFKIDKSYIGDRETAEISRSDLWHMHNGVWCWLMILMGATAALIHTVAYWRGRRRSANQSSEQGGGGQAATRAESK